MDLNDPQARDAYGSVILRCGNNVTDRYGNEMNRALGHLCAQTGQGEPPEDGEMNEMTLSSRHRIRNSSPGGLRPSTLPLGHGCSLQ